MRILAITAFYPPHHSGGYELRCQDVLKGLIKRGHQVAILTNRCPNSNCSIHPGETGIHRALHLRLEKTPVFTQIHWDQKDLRTIDRFIQNFAPDLIYLWHIQNLSNALLPYFSTKNIPIVYDEGGSGLDYLCRVQKRGIYFYKNHSDSFLKKWLKRSIYQTARLVSGNLIQPDWDWPQSIQVYFNSHAAKQHALEQGALVTEAAVIHSGIDLATFPMKPRESLAQPITIIIPSRMKKAKGIADAIPLALELQRKKIDVRITVVGKIQSDEYYNELVQLIEEYDLHELITLLPMVDQKDLSLLYRENDFCFFPSYFKTGFSRVPLEAMASGCLVITYGNEGSYEAIQNGINGFIIPEGDVISSAQVIEKLIYDSETYSYITQNAYYRVKGSFNNENYFTEIEKFLMESKKDK